MSYATVKDLPEEIKGQYKGRKLRQFMYVVNTELESGKTHEAAEAAAHAVAGSKALDWDSIYDVMDRQVSQANSGYNPIGGTDSKACANCNWFVVKRDACILVSGDIVATGLSDYWEEKQEYVFEPMHVIVDNKGSESLTSKVKSMWETFTTLFNLAKAVNKEDPELSGIYFVSKEGEPTRFFIWASNNFKDKHGEIITEAAHKEFVQWCDDNNTYPELWLWHAAGTKSGQVDWMDYIDGFLVTSGLIEPDAEVAIKSLEGQDIRCSHGFLGRWKGALCTQYRSWEVSILPGTNVANPWTSYVALKEEAKMPFNEKKREWLMKTAGVDEVKIKEWEDATTQMREHLTSLGIEFKSDESDELPENANIQDEMIKSMLKAQQESTIVIAGLAEQVAILKKGDDEKLVEMIKSEVSKLPSGFRPASSKETEVPTDAAAETDEEKEKKGAWFKELASPFTR